MHKNCAAREVLPQICVVTKPILPIGNDVRKVTKGQCHLVTNSSHKLFQLFILQINIHAIKSTYQALLSIHFQCNSQRVELLVPRRSIVDGEHGERDSVLDAGLAHQTGDVRLDGSFFNA